jgi:hypothetical protein
MKKASLEKPSNITERGTRRSRIANTPMFA